MPEVTLKDLLVRVEELESIKPQVLPIPTVTPGSSKEEIIKKLNWLINYINIGAGK